MRRIRQRLVRHTLTSTPRFWRCLADGYSNLTDKTLGNQVLRACPAVSDLLYPSLDERPGQSRSHADFSSHLITHECYRPVERLRRFGWHPLFGKLAQQVRNILGVGHHLKLKGHGALLLQQEPDSLQVIALQLATYQEHLAPSSLNAITLREFRHTLVPVRHRVPGGDRLTLIDRYTAIDNDHHTTLHRAVGDSRDGDGLTQATAHDPIRRLDVICKHGYYLAVPSRRTLASIAPLP